MVVLTVQAIKAAGTIEYGQISVAVFCTFGMCIFGIPAARTAGADKITDTVCGKRVVIKRQISLMRSPATNTLIFYMPETAEPGFIFRDFALMNTQIAGNPVIGIRRSLRKSVELSTSVVNLFNLRPDTIEMGSDTLGAKTDGIGDGSITFFTKTARSHNKMNYN